MQGRGAKVEPLQALRKLGRADSNQMLVQLARTQQQGDNHGWNKRGPR